MLVYLYVCKAFYCCVSSVFVVPEGKKKKSKQEFARCNETIFYSHGSNC